MRDLTERRRARAASQRGCRPLGEGAQRLRGSHLMHVFGSRFAEL